MKIVPYVRQKPDIQTDWGNYTSPYIVYHPEDYKNRQPGPPDQTRGRHAIRNQPRPVGIRSMVTDVPPGIEGPTSAYSGYYEVGTPIQPLGQPSVGNVTTPTKKTWVEWLLIIGALGAFGFLMYKLFASPTPSLPYSNPKRRQTRQRKKGGGSISYKKSKGRSEAAKRHKCKLCGVFIPYGRTYCDKCK